MTVTDDVRRHATLAAIGALLAMGTSVLASCGDARPAANEGASVSPATSGSAGAASCGSPHAGCPCAEPGATAPCGQVNRVIGAGLVSCSEGIVTCHADGAWSECEGDRTYVASAGTVTTRGLGSPSIGCAENPCDPYCGEYLDTPEGLDAGAGLSATEAGLTMVGASGDAGPQLTLVYGHSRDKLYSVSPSTFATTLVGAFKNGAASVTDMTDIAIDKAGQMWGVSFGSLYKLDYTSTPGTVKCTKLASLATSFNGLTFVPAGMGLDAVNETLIGVANDGGWWRVNLSPVSLTKLGSYGAGYTSSGDSVGIIGDKVYATVNKSGNSKVMVVTVNPATGAVIANLGATSVPTGTGIFGVGYWGGTMYGFAGDGKVYLIDLTNAATTYLSRPTTEWWGAGVTTSAPPTPTVYANGRYARAFDSACQVGFGPRWQYLDWKSQTPADSKIEIYVQSADSVAGLDLAPQALLATVTGPPSTTWTGVDVEPALVAAGSKSRRHLRVTFSLEPSADGLSSPTLVAWRQRYDCVPVE